MRVEETVLEKLKRNWQGPWRRLLALFSCEEVVQVEPAAVDLKRLVVQLPLQSSVDVDVKG
jgi:hypothetical protein